MNHYAFVNGNPISSVDPLGLCRDQIITSGLKNPIFVPEPDNPALFTRIGGAFDLFFGLAEALVGGVLVLGGGGASVTGVGTAPGAGTLLFGATVFGHVVDYAAAGWMRLWTGRPAAPLTAQGLHAWGMEMDTANTVNGFLSAGLTLGAGISRAAMMSGAGALEGGAIRAGSAIDQLLVEARAAYPTKAGVTELHHVTPMYLGGARNGARVPLDGAYHQFITNEFRSIWPYGGPKPSPQELQRILREVYQKYPLPGQ